MSANGTAGKTSRPSILGKVMDRLRQICIPPRTAREVQAPPLGHDFQDPIEHALARLISLTGWDSAAVYFTETEDTWGFRYEQMLTVPRAPHVGGVTMVPILLASQVNQATMFKRIELVPANCTAERFGRATLSKSSRKGGPQQPEPPNLMTQELGLQPQNGRVVIEQSVIREDDGTLTLEFSNFDPFSDARFSIDIYGWVVER